MKKVLTLYEIMYGRTYLEKVEEYVQNWIEYREYQFEEGNGLLIAIEEIMQIREEFELTEKERFLVWMLG